MKAFVFDANVMNSFQRERVQGEQGHSTSAVQIAFQNGFILLDEEGLCRSEWLECAGGSFPLALADWIADMLAAENIRLTRYTCDSMFRELSKQGLPKKDHKWVRLARSGNSDNIVTDDIDLFCPQEKGCSAARSEKIKKSCKGPMAKYLAKHYGITVVTPFLVGALI